MQNRVANYERNRDHRSRKRFRNVEQDKGRLSSSRARSEVPSRGYKSMTNLSALPADEGEQNSTASTISKIWKWLKHNSGKDAGPTGATGAVPSERKSGPTLKVGYYGHLGLGEYVGAIDDDFVDDDEEEMSGIAKPLKSRSLINISVSNLWAGENTEIEEIVVERPPSDTPRSRKCSSTTEATTSIGCGRQSLLDIIARRISSAPPPVSLVALFELHLQLPLNRLGENVETTSFGAPEERWGLPAYVLANDLRFHPGEQFTLHRLHDYLSELNSTIQWSQAVSQICDEQLKRERQGIRGRRQKRLSDCAPPGAYADVETELKDLRVELACFQSKTAAFLQQKKKELRSNAAVLVANDGHFSSTCCLLPTVVESNNREQVKPEQIALWESPYRLLMDECYATLKMHPASSTFKETATQVLLLICTDVVLLVRPCQTEEQSDATSYTIVACAPVAFLGIQQPSTGRACSSQNASLDTSSENSINLSQHSILPPASQGDSAIGTSVSPQPAFLSSSSSGVSTASNEDLAEGQMEDGMFTGSESCCSAQQSHQLATAVLADSEGCSTDNVLSLYWPPNHRYCLQFPDFRSWIHCRSQLQCAIDQAQGVMAAHQLMVKVMNHVAPENCVHKYLRINLSVTAAKLREQALEAFNVSRSGYNSAIFASYTDAATAPYEIKLADDDRPFLLALYFASLEEQKTRTGDAKPTGDCCFCAIPRVPSLPIGPEKIPITFSLRQVKSEVKKMVELQLPEVIVEGPEQTTRRRSRERPFSTLYDGRSSHLHGLRGLRSQSSYNLNELGNSKGDCERRGRSKSRARNARTGHFSRFRAPTDARSAPRQSVIFGQLPQDIWPDCRVSMSIMSLFVTVFYKGSLIEGIFRKSALKSHQELMVLRVDSDDDPLSAEDCPPLLAASTLKQFFGQIPGHLLIDDYWTDWCELLQIQSDAELIAHAKMMMRRLPDVNQSLLAFLLFTLAQIRANEDTNRMSTLALATVWGPNLISRPNAQFTVEDSKIVCEIASVLIGRVTDLFFLQKADFHRTLSRVYQDFWAQINPTETPVPEGVSILYVEEPKTPESRNSESLRREKRVRRPRISHSVSAEASSSTEATKLSPNSSSKETFKFPVVKNYRRLPPLEQPDVNSPPPIPPRLSRCSPALSYSSSDSQDKGSSPVTTVTVRDDRKPLPPEPVLSPKLSTSENVSREEMIAFAQSRISPNSGRRLKKISPSNIFMDRRRISVPHSSQGFSSDLSQLESFSPLPSRYPICHSAPRPTGEYTPIKLSYLPSSPSTLASTGSSKTVPSGEQRSKDAVPMASPTANTKASTGDVPGQSPLRRSSSDVDAQLQNRYLTINRRRDNHYQVESPSLLDDVPERTFSDVTRLQQSHYTPYLFSHFTLNQVDGVNQAEFISCYDTSWVCQLLSDDAAPRRSTLPCERSSSLQPSPRGQRILKTPEELRERFSATRGDGSHEYRSPDEVAPIHVRRMPVLKHCNSSLVESSQSRVAGDANKVGRRINSLYEQNKGADRSSKNYSRPDAPQQTGSGNGTEVHLSRGSSHASTGSSCSTLIGTNGMSTSAANYTPTSGDCTDY
ncbi:hypothetical protein AAHC03_021067 [Spirometra sp. Aus1]